MNHPPISRSFAARVSRLFLAVLTVLAAPASARLSAADDVLPRAQPTARYDAMAARSPFTAPTAVVAATPPPVVAGPHWWDQMYLTSLMELGGTCFAAVVDRASGKHYLLERNKPDEASQLMLAEVQWSEHTNQSTVVVRKGGEVAPPLHFDATAAPPAPSYALQPSADDLMRAKASTASTSPPSVSATHRGTVFTGPGSGQVNPGAPSAHGQPPVVEKIRPHVN